jgi:hypothetical protein
VLILVVEFIGLTSVLPYGLMLPVYTASSGSKGLPIDDGRVVLPADKRFNVHILVPCYKVRAEGGKGEDGVCGCRNFVQSFGAAQFVVSTCMSQAFKSPTVCTC